MNRQIEWFCYHITHEGLVTPEQCRDLARDFAEAGQEPDLEVFAQTVVDSGICTDYERLGELGTLAMEEADALVSPPVDVIGSLGTGKPKLALKRVVPRRNPIPAMAPMQPGSEASSVSPVLHGDGEVPSTASGSGSGCGSMIWKGVRGVSYLFALLILMSIGKGALHGLGCAPSMPGAGGGTERAAKDFMRTWVDSGPQAAAAALDNRPGELYKDVVRTLELKSFDGNVRAKGEGTWTVYETGVQYRVDTFRVKAVANLGGTFLPVVIEVSVCKDSRKVLVATADM